MSGQTAYEVIFTVREHFSTTVAASSAAEARAIVREGRHEGEWVSHSDRIVTGIRVLKADRP